MEGARWTKSEELPYPDRSTSIPNSSCSCGCQDDSNKHLLVHYVMDKKHTGSYPSDIVCRYDCNITSFYKYGHCLDHLCKACYSPSLQGMCDNHINTHCHCCGQVRESAEIYFCKDCTCPKCNVRICRMWSQEYHDHLQSHV